MALADCTNSAGRARSPLSPAWLTAAAWAFAIFVTAVVPWAVLRNRDSALAMASVPLHARFFAMLIPQVVLGGLAIAMAALAGIEIFPLRAPSLEAWLLGSLFLATCVVLIRPHWRRSIEEEKPAWRLFAPLSPRERRMWIALSLSAGIAEELVWRGVLPAVLVGLTGSVTAAIALSVFSFALAHAIQGLKSVLAIASIAAAFHALVAVSGSLYVAMAVHFVYDVIAGFSYARFAKEAGFLDPPIPEAPLPLGPEAQAPTESRP